MSVLRDITESFVSWSMNSVLDPFDVNQRPTTLLNKTSCAVFEKPV